MEAAATLSPSQPIFLLSNVLLLLHFFLLRDRQMVSFQLLSRHPTRALDRQILSLHALGEGNHVPHGIRVRQHSDQPIETKREPSMRRTSRPQRLEQVRELGQARIRHFEDVAHHVLLHGRQVDTATAAAELDAVDDEVIVVGARLERVGGEQLDVGFRERRGKGVVRRFEPGLAALAGVDAVVRSEHGEVDDPEELEVEAPRQETGGYEGVVEVGAGDAEGRGAFALEGGVLARLEDEHVAVFKVGKGFHAGECVEALEAKGGQAAERLLGVEHEGGGSSVGVLGKGLGELVHEFVDELGNGSGSDGFAVELGTDAEGLDDGLFGVRDHRDKLGGKDMVDTVKLELVVRQLDYHIGSGKTYLEGDPEVGLVDTESCHGLVICEPKKRGSRLRPLKVTIFGRFAVVQATLGYRIDIITAFHDVELGIQSRKQLGDKSLDSAHDILARGKSHLQIKLHRELLAYDIEESP